MDLVSTIAEVRAAVAAARAHGRTIAFVPTMGALHAGHVALLDEARRRGGFVVLSIFVNPTQFGPKEDLTRYPRDLDGDLAKARAAGVDLVFHPTVGEMYPDGYQTFVEVRELSRPLCGASRPGHFTGVATVVLKLFQIVQPNLAIFGEKDFQQLQVIRRMARDLHLPVKILGYPIVREPDSLARSSRNAYLSPEERHSALALSRALSSAETAFRSGVRDPAALLETARSIVSSTENMRIDYLELRDRDSLVPIEGEIVRPAVLAVAAFVGATRLIDNVELKLAPAPDRD